MAEKKKIRADFQITGAESDENLEKIRKILQNFSPEERAEILAEAALKKFVEEEGEEVAEEEGAEGEFIYGGLEGDGVKAPKLKFKIDRKQKEFIVKTKTPLWKIEDMFINEQEARRNSPYTIAYYKRCFKKFYEAIAFMYEDGNKDFIETVYNEAPSDEPSPLAYVGKMFPMVVLEDMDLQLNYVKYLSEIEEVNEQTVNSYLRGLKALIMFCVENEWIEERRFTITNKEPNIKQCYTDTELKKLTRKPNLENSSFPTYRNWVIVNHLLATGNRVQTVLNIKVEDIDLEDGFLNVQVQKNKKTTRIPLPKKYLRILNEYILLVHTDETGEIQKDNYLFPNEFGNKFTAEGLKKAVANYNHSRGVEKTSFHLFRHTFAKNWILSGGDIVSLQKILGHSTLEMAQKYANLYAEDIKPKVEKHSTINKVKNNGGRAIKIRIPK